MISIALFLLFGSYSSHAAECPPYEQFSRWQKKCVKVSKLCTAKPCLSGEIKDVDCKCVAVPHFKLGLDNKEMNCPVDKSFSVLQKKCVTPHEVCTMQMCGKGMEKDIDCSCQKSNIDIGSVEPVATPAPVQKKSKDVQINQ